MISDAPIKALHDESPLRVWSLIVTIFGDIVMQQGRMHDPAPIWSGAILKLLTMMHIEPGLARTSLSRLVANKMLTRIKVGRNTFYQLGVDSRDDFKRAAHHIYGRKPLKPTGQFELVVIEQCEDRQQVRDELLTKGYRFIGTTVAIKPVYFDCVESALPSHVISSIALPSASLSAAVQNAWKIEALNDGYMQFLKLFADGIIAANVSPEVAIVTRILLVHQYRRLILRDPQLPVDALPKNWKGEAARVRFASNLAALSTRSEAWIAETGFLSGKADSDP